MKRSRKSKNPQKDHQKSSLATFLTEMLCLGSRCFPTSVLVWQTTQHKARRFLHSDSAAKSSFQPLCSSSITSGLAKLVPQSNPLLPKAGHRQQLLSFLPALTISFFTNSNFACLENTKEIVFAGNSGSKHGEATTTDPIRCGGVGTGPVSIAGTAQTSACLGAEFMQTGTERLNALSKSSCLANKIRN